MKPATARSVTFAYIALALFFLLAVNSCGDDAGQPASSASQSPTAAASAGASPTGSGPAVTAFPTPPPGEWSGDPEGALAYVSFREVKQEIFIKQLPDGEEINLTNNPADDFDPDISDDGSRVLFVSNRTGQSQVWVMNADGSDPRQLTDDNGGGQTPRWSRDGTMIAFSRGAGDVAIMNADGTDIRTVMEAQQEATAEPCRAGAFVGGWSPDDSRITYYSASVTRQTGQVCTVAVDGSDIRDVVDDPAAYSVEPVYSPDGKQIVYRAIVNGQHDIWIADLESGQKWNLTHNADLDIEPDWSPDGQWIAFGSIAQGEPNFNLYVMRPDGSDVRQITTDPPKEANPVWAP